MELESRLVDLESLQAVISLSFSKLSGFSNKLNLFVSLYANPINQWFSKRGPGNNNISIT